MINKNIFIDEYEDFEDEDERRLQDVFKTSSSRRMFAGSIHKACFRIVYTVSEEFFVKYF